MTQAANESGNVAADPEGDEGNRFGGSLGSQHKDAAQQGPNLQQGPSGGGPRQPQPPHTIGSQLGGVGGQSSSPTNVTPAQPKRRKSGCFGLLLVAVGAGAVVVSALPAF